MYGIASDPDGGGIAVQLVDGTILKLDIGKKNYTVLYRHRGFKTFFMLNSGEHEIYPAHKC